MSDPIAFPLLAAVFIFGSFLSYYMSSMAHEKSDKIAIGVKDGVPIPLSYRWVLLYMMFIPWGVSAAAVTPSWKRANHPRPCREQQRRPC